jgi:hydroxymethylbilane synthase
MTKISSKSIKIATRKSPLALWQAEYVANSLTKYNKNISVDLIEISTEGDRLLGSSLSNFGGKGLFVKELENTLIEGSSDLAVHSAKDMPHELPDGLELGIICERGNPNDALVLPNSKSELSLTTTIDQLKSGSVIGTSSLRRKCQILNYRSDLKFKTLRGNINTRLKKLDAGEYDAIILAAAGLERLGLEKRISSIIDRKILLPAVAQGALSVETRIGDKAVSALLNPLSDINSSLCVTAERAMSRYLDTGCQAPVAGFAECIKLSSKLKKIKLEGRVASIDGKKLLSAFGEIDVDLAKGMGFALEDVSNLGVQVARTLSESGALEIIEDAKTKFLE